MTSINRRNLLMALTSSGGGALLGMTSNGVAATAAMQTKLIDSVSASDFPTLQAAIDAATIQGKAVLVKGQTFFCEKLNITTSLIGEGRESSIIILKGPAFVAASNVLIQGLTFSAGDSEFNGSEILKVSSGSNQVRIIDNSIGYVRQSSKPYSSIYGVRFDTSGKGCQDFVVQNNKFVDIFKVTLSDATATDGFCGGIFFDASSRAKNTSSGIVCGNVFDTIRTVGNSRPSKSDADGIRFYSGNSDTLDANPILIDGNLFIDVQKSAIKVSGYGGLTITNTKIVNTQDELMQAAIRLQTGNNIVVDGVHASGHFEYGFVMSGNYVTVRNVQFNYHKTGQIKYSLVFLQKRQAGVETGITLENAFARSCTAVIDTMDTLGNANSQWFDLVRLANIRISTSSNSTFATLVTIKNASNVRILDMDVDGAYLPSVVFYFDNVFNLNIKNISCGAVEKLIQLMNSQPYISIDSGDIIINDVRSIRAANSSYKFSYIDIKNGTSGAAINGVVDLSNVKLESGFAESSGTHELIRVKALGRVSMNNISVCFRGAGKFPVNTIKGVLSNFIISGLNVVNEISVNGGVAIHLTDSSKGLVSNVNVSGNYHGVVTFSTSFIQASSVRVDDGNQALINHP